MVVLREEFERKYIHCERWEEIQTKFEELETSILDNWQELTEDFKKFKVQEETSLDHTCKDFLEANFSKYQKVVNSFAQFFNCEDLSQ